MRTKIHLRSNYFFFLRNNLFLFLMLFISILLLFIFTLTSCKDNQSGNDTSDSEISSDTSNSSNLSGNNTSNTLIPFSSAISWGPINISKEYVEDLYIKNNIGVGSVSYNNGKSDEGTYLYAIDVYEGNLIGDVRIPGRINAIDICEGYAFVWVKDGINVYDLKKNFEFVQTLPGRWVSNLGNYFFVEDPKAPDYLIDKRTLKKKDLNISDDNYVFGLLYPDCLIGDSYAFDNGKQDEPVVYSLIDEKILGHLKSEYLSKIFAWDPEKNLLFCKDRDKIKVYDLSTENFISELPLSYNDVLSIVVNNQRNPTYFGSENMPHFIRDIYCSENGFYFFNCRNSAYILNSSGNIESQIKDSSIIGEHEDYIFFKQEDNLGSNQSVFANTWIKAYPEEPFGTYPLGPYFTEGSLAWLCDSSGLKGHGDAIYQWDYKTSSFLNYTEFTGYDVNVLSSYPFILAIRSQEGGTDADWYLVCIKPSELPFNLIPDIEMDYNPDEIYAESTEVKFTCSIKNIPAEVQSQNITYEWDFGDGMTGSGQEVTHTYGIKGNYNVSVSVKLGDSPDSSTKSIKLAVLASPGIQLVATPKYLTAEGITYVLECKIGELSDIGGTEWDFGDGTKSTGGLVMSHIYKPGNYVAKVKLYNFGKSESWVKEINIESKLPDFSTTASPPKGYTALKVNFNCSLLSSTITDSGLKYQWKIGSEVISDKKSFDKVFIDPGNYSVKLEIRDPGSKLITEKNLNIVVYPPHITFTDGGLKIKSDSPILIEVKYDKDKDGINQIWEDEAMLSANPYIELDEEEDLLNNTDTDKVVNFVRITPYPSASNPKFILFYYCITWTQDYGRYISAEIPIPISTLNIFKAHNGDVEKLVMAWKYIDDYNLELKYVYTSAHGGSPTDHCAVWDAGKETCNEGKVMAGFDQEEQEFCGTLEFDSNILKIQASEDKHALYPSIECGDSVILVAGLFGEDVGSDGLYQYRLPCYNAGEPAVHLMDDISDIFPNERIWSGNKYHTGSFCGGLDWTVNCPGKIGNSLSDLGNDDILKEKLDAEK